MLNNEVIAAANIQSYQDADNFLGSKQNRKLCGNTFVERENDYCIFIRFFHSKIIYYFKNGMFQ